MTEKNIQFIKVEFNTMDYKDYRYLMTSNKGIEMTYQWLRRYIVRSPMKTPWLNEVYEKYYLKGKLASSVTIETLMEDLNLAKDTILKNLKILKDNGIMDVAELDTKKHKGMQKKQKVYIFGKWKTHINEEGKEIYNEYFTYDEKVLAILTEQELNKTVKTYYNKSSV
jgi:DNA-binding transcriptional ArsR family regulator